MIDDISFSELIEKQISSTVREKVNELVNDRVWFEQLEHEIILAIQQKVVTRFSNIETVPDLIKTVENSVEQLFLQGRIPGFEKFVDTDRINRVIDAAVENLIQTTIDNLVVDSSWLARIESLINQSMSAKLANKLSELNLNKLIVEQIDLGIDRWQDRLKQDFATNGIRDESSSLQMTVMDNTVVVENELISNYASVEKDAEVKGTLSVNDLVLKGRINLDNNSWSELSSTVADHVLQKTTVEWRNSLVADVLETARESGIDFENISIKGSPLVSSNQLNRSITDTNIEKTGTLRDLTVAGKTRLANTVTAHNRRVGINTEDPEMALSIWDEEVAVILGKNAEKTAYIGTARSHNLVIGVNRKAAITVDTDGLTTVRQLRLDRFRLSHAADVPGHSGTRGDLIFNSDPKPKSPFAWVCLGGFKWQPLRSA
jgi:hypothetical protein